MKYGILRVTAGRRSRETKVKNPGSVAESQYWFYCTLQEEKRKPHTRYAPAVQTDHNWKCGFHDSRYC